MKKSPVAVLYSTASSGGVTVWDLNAAAGCGSYSNASRGNSGPPLDLADQHPFQGWLFAPFHFQKLKFRVAAPLLFPTFCRLYASH